MKRSLPVFEGWSPFMSIMEFKDNNWNNLRVKHTSTVSIHPAAMGIQFGVSVFEGMKFFKTSKDSYNIFRIKDHYLRFKKSCERLLIPCPSYEIFCNAIELISNKIVNWNNPFESEWLYIRPIILSNESSIFPIPSSEYSFYVLSAPLREYQEDINLFVECYRNRAATNGLGSYKTSANYAHQFLSTKEAKENGCNNVLWLDESGKNIEEANTMNIFIKFKNKIVTPPLKKTILAGITRDTIINIIKEQKLTIVEESDVAIEELVNHIKNNEISEIFATSTGLGIKHITSILYNNHKYYTNKETTFSNSLLSELKKIYRGNYNKWIQPKQFV